MLFLKYITALKLWNRNWKIKQQRAFNKKNRENFIVAVLSKDKISVADEQEWIGDKKQRNTMTGSVDRDRGYTRNLQMLVVQLIGSQQL